MNDLVRYDPFTDMQRMFERMNRLMHWPFERDLSWPEDANPLAIDMTSDGNQVVVKTALPGVKENDVHVEVRGNVLTISAETRAARENRDWNWYMREMRYGRFARSIRLPDEVNVDKAEAKLEDGVLTVTLPHQRPSPLKRIAVTAQKLLKGQR
ncbi:MAG TPA: Hsp20/alpha crystallin family protein [Spirillospora sp.]|nr:Hsp20/alpha crystallin family protein [Spirillospora sp.]